MTWKPAASRTSTAALAVWGWKWLLKVSGQRMTRGCRRCAAARRDHQALKVSGANDGVVRRVEIPPSNWNSLPKTGACVSEVDEARRQRGEPRPPVDQAHRVGVPGPQPSLIVMREELGLVRGHVDVHRASLLQPLQARHRSSASLTVSLFQPPFIGSPWSISKSRWARPRVECISSLVTM